MINRYRLFIPGPTDVASEVLAELAAPVVAHYGDEWVAVYNATLVLLRQVFQTQEEVFILPGSGTAGIEACMRLLAAPGDKVVVGVNGAFGERLVDMCELNGFEVVRVESEWGEPVTPEQMSATLAAHNKAAFACIVHNETSTGLVNPIRELSLACHSIGVPFLVDAVSSLGAVDLRMDEWGLTVCASASQKCLETPPGLALVCVADEAWELAERRSHPRGFYLSLLYWRKKAKEWADWHPFPVTQPTSNILAFKKSLELIVEQGLAQRFRRHERMAEEYRSALRELGFHILASPDYASPATTTALCPEGLQPKDLRRRLKERHRLLVAGGQGKLEESAIRIGHFGQAASEEYLSVLLAALKDCLSQ